LRHRVGKLATLALLVALLAACATSRSFRRGQEAARSGDWDVAVALLTKAVQDAPQRADYRIELERAMLKASLVRLSRARELDAAGERESAIVEYRKAVEYDPSNRSAMMRAAELERILRDEFEATRPRPKIDEMRSRVRRETTPLLNPASRDPIDLRFANASTKDILDFIGDSTGINVTYERDFRPQPFSITLNRVTLEEALQQIMSANQLWYKVINDRTILIIPDNNQKRQQYEEQVIRTFFVSHADPQELAQLVQQITRLPGAPIQPTVAVNKTANTITVRATAGVAEIVEKLIEANDRPRAEVVVDVEILEVSRARAKEFGLNLGDYSVGTIFSPEQAPASGAANPPFNLNTVTRGISAADFYMTVPQAVAKFLATDSQTRSIAKPQLRGMEGQKLTLNLGDEIPVPSTTFTPFAAGGAATNPLTSYQYKSVGVILEITPRVTYEGEIVLDISVESSNVGDSINVAGQALPTFGSRRAVTRLRLREGESNLLAGLLRDIDRKALRGLPGIMNLPVLKQLFSSNDQRIEQADLVILITPRIVRTHELTEENLRPIYIGTQQNIGLTGPPTLIAPQEPEQVPDEPPAPGTAPGLPPGVRLPDGTAPTPTAPPGSSPIPGTTTAPPTTPPPAEPQPQPVVPPEPAAVPPPAPAEPPAMEAGMAQIVLTPPGTEFRMGGGPYIVPVSITGVSRVSVVSLTVTFNPQVLRVRAVQEGSFLRQGGVAVTFTQQVDAEAGRVDISMTRTNDETGASGAGLLAAILFEPAAPGASTLSINGIATTPQGQAIPVAFSSVAVTVR
jgi:general secretion pathway protein D